MRKTLVPLAVAIAASVSALTPGSGAHAADTATVPTEPACSDVVDGFGEAETVGDAIAGNPELSVFAAAIDSVGLDEALDSDEPVTVFVAGDEAFGQIPANVLESILADGDLLASILNYHVVPGDAMQPTDIAHAGSIGTLSGEEITFTVDGDSIVVNDGAATICGVAGFGTGTVLIVDSVLQPPSTGMGGPGSSAPGSSNLGSSVPVFTAEQDAVATAFETAVDSSLTYDEQAPFIEDAEALRETIENYPTAAEVVMGISADVTSVTIDGDTAAITYVLSFNGVDAGYGELEGTMMLVDGAWVVPQDEYCAFQAQARNNCPA